MTTMTMTTMRVLLVLLGMLGALLVSADVGGQMKPSTTATTMTVPSILAEFPETVYGNVPFVDPLPIIITSALLHGALFLLAPTRVLARSGLADEVIRSYLVSTVHAIYAIIAVIAWSVYFDMDLSNVRRTLGGGLDGTGDEWIPYGTAVTCGYFLYDTLCMLVYPKTASAGSYVHHLCLGSALALALYVPPTRCMQFLLMFEELSTPALNFKGLLKHHERLSAVCALLFALTFLGSRIVYGMYLYFTALAQSPSFLHYAWTDGAHLWFYCALFQITMCSISRVLNVYWAVLIVRKLAHSVCGGGAKGEKRSAAYATVPPANKKPSRKAD